MKNRKNIFLSLTLFCALTLTFGQNVKKQALITKALTSEVIENQFDALVLNSPNFEKFKNIRLTNLNKFTANFKDSIVATKLKFSNAQTKITNQSKEITQLKTTINKTNTDLGAVSDQKNSINFFGTQISKVLYNTILWSIILGLLAATLFFLFKFKNSNLITKSAETTLAEVENEFETHKKKSLEREQVLRRKLQDEINKQRNVK